MSILYAFIEYLNVLCLMGTWCSGRLRRVNCLTTSLTRSIQIWGRTTCIGYRTFDLFMCLMLLFCQLFFVACVLCYHLLLLRMSSLSAGRWLRGSQQRMHASRTLGRKRRSIILLRLWLRYNSRRKFNAARLQGCSTIAGRWLSCGRAATHIALPCSYNRGVRRALSVVSVLFLHETTISIVSAKHGTHFFVPEQGKI